MRFSTEHLFEISLPAPYFQTCPQSYPHLWITFCGKLFFLWKSPQTGRVLSSSPFSALLIHMAGICYNEKKSPRRKEVCHDEKKACRIGSVCRTGSVPPSSRQTSGKEKTDSASKSTVRREVMSGSGLRPGRRRSRQHRRWSAGGPPWRGDPLPQRCRESASGSPPRRR